ncbi:MAG TPA: response regulator, partial [Cyclobacteriaceae bacterium]|nr:response regulator [Cyclobacteriaceae bacterium]
TILVVDDNNTNRAILKKQLTQWGLKPVLASSGAAAIALLSSPDTIDLILSDMQMPGMDGVALAQWVHGHTPAIPIILLSSVGDERSKTMTKLFASCMTKPVRLNTLCNHILTALHKTDSPKQQSVRNKQKLSIEFAREHPMKILIAEDNEVNQKLTLRVLTKLGYNADIAVDGREAVDMMRENNYDMILMDVQMPVMDGLEATRILREPAGHQPIIMAMTANVMTGDRENCLEAGMNDYITKPINLDEIMAKLNKWAKKIKTTAEIGRTV